MKNNLLMILLLFISGYISEAQLKTSKGTEFWFAFLGNVRADMNYSPEYSFIISSEYNTTGKITMPLGDLEMKFSLSSGEVKEIFLPSNLTWIPEEKTYYYSLFSEVIDSLGFRIVSEKPISVYAMHYRSYFTDGTLVLPKEELGDDYLVMACKDYKIQPDPSSLVIAGIDDDTEIQITTPTETAEGRAKGIPFNIILDAGETYQIESTFEGFDPFYAGNFSKMENPDLTGTRIKSLNNKKFAVFSGAKQASSLYPYPDNHLFDQDYPLESRGDIFVYIPYLNQGGDIVKILASDNNTIIKFDCMTDTVLNSGEFCRTILHQPTLITANHKITVAQIAKPLDFNANQYGDPTFMILPPLSYSCKTAIFKKVGPSKVAYIDTQYVNIIVKTKAKKDLLFNDSIIAGSFKTIPALPEYSYTQLVLDEDDNKITCPEGFYAYVYGVGYADAYSYHLGYDQSNDLRILGVSLPDTVGMVGDNNFGIQLKIDADENILPLPLENVKIKLHFNASTFYPKRIDNGIMRIRMVNGEFIVDISIDTVLVSKPGQVLLTLHGIVMNSDSIKVHLIIDSFDYESEAPVLTTICGEKNNTNGSLEISGCALQLSRIKIFAPPELAVYPNPAGDHIKLLIRGVCPGNNTIEVYTVRGKRIYLEKWFYGEKDNLTGDKKLTIDMSNFDSGLYCVVYKSSDIVISKTITIIK